MTDFTLYVHYNFTSAQTPLLFANTFLNSILDIITKGK